MPESKTSRKEAQVSVLLLFLLEEQKKSVCTAFLLITIFLL